MGPVAWPPRLPDFSPLHSNTWSHVNGLVYSAPFENEKTLYQRIFMPIKPFAIAPRTSKSVRQYVIVLPAGSLMQVEKNLRICCEFRIDKHYE
jgi:hypothetical protein